MPLQAIVLDFNGVIIDDESIHFEYIRDLVRPFGIELDWQMYSQRYIAYSDEEVFEIIFKDFGIRVESTVIESLCHEKYRKYLSDAVNRVSLYPGVREFIEGASLQYPLAIATGARRDEVLAILHRFNMENYIHVIVTADDVARGKPEPDIYLEAVKRLGIRAPGDCVAIEDTPGGIQAAKRAGLKVLAVPHTCSVDNLKEADLILFDGFVNFPWVQVKLLMDEG